MPDQFSRDGTRCAIDEAGVVPLNIVLTASVRLFTFSARSNAVTCAFTVPAAIPSSRLITLFGLPCTIRRSTSARTKEFYRWIPFRPAPR